MISNLLKIVSAADGSSLPTSLNDNGHSADNWKNSSGNPLATTVGGFLFGLGTAADIAPDIASSSPSSSRRIIGSSGGRSYYSDHPYNSCNAEQGGAERRRREAAAAVTAIAAVVRPDARFHSFSRTVAVRGNNCAISSSVDSQPHHSRSFDVNEGVLVYRGRKIIPDVSHLYEVVNDCDAYENYDTLMNMIMKSNGAAKNASQPSIRQVSGVGIYSDGTGRDGHMCVCDETIRDRENMKEEELVYRMLSQFPEFGTNFPTPFTAMDENDVGKDDLENFCDGPVAPNALYLSSDATGRRGYIEHNHSPKFSAEDATDMIGRFFFGLPSSVVPVDGKNSSNDAPPETNVVAGHDKVGLAVKHSDRNEFGRISSSGSSSTLSTSVTAAKAMATTFSVLTPLSARGLSVGGENNRRRVGEGVDDIGAEDIVNIFAGIENAKEWDRLTAWDQDEIDLWNASSSQVLSGAAFMRSRVLLASKRPVVSPISVSLDDDGMSVGGLVNWASRRRMHRERRRNRQDWDALANISVDVPSEMLAIMSAPYSPTNAFPNHHALLSVFSDRALYTLSLSPTRMESRTRETGRQYERARAGVGRAAIIDNGKQHWMPDNLCKLCYSCDAQFTLVRRKHHCRICGMIFCSACSAYFIQILSSDGDLSVGIGASGSRTFGTMRTCQSCHNQLSERGLDVVISNQLGTLITGRAKSDNGSSATVELKRTSSVEEAIFKKQVSHLGAHNTTETDLLFASTTQSDKITKISIGVNSTRSAESTQQITCFHGPGGASVTGDFRALSITKQQLDKEKRKNRKHAEAEVTAQLAAKEKVEVEALVKDQQSSTVVGNSFRVKRLESWQWRGQCSDETPKKKFDAGFCVEGFSDCTHDAPAEILGEHAGSFFSSTTHQQPPLLCSLAPTSIVEKAPSGQILCHDAKRHLGMVAAEYLEKLTRELIHTDAPLLLEEIKAACEVPLSTSQQSKLITLWVNSLMTLATRCCATVEPDVKNGDLLDIRPYCKVKVIPGGSVKDFAYVSGIVFHKNVSHKKMAQSIINAKVMLLSGGIEYTRTENRIASLDTLLEQEERYMEILVSKIFKLKPNILLVGKSVCRKAHELLLRANIVLIQYVKPALMSRIARQTGATVLSSIDHVMNFSVLGYCRRLRLVSFRDNDVWIDENALYKSISPDQKRFSVLLSHNNVPNHVRQAALAARQLGEGVFDGTDAVTSGLAKRGVVQTYVMIEGCAKELGCSAIVRGASRSALRMVKRVLQFLVNAAYNMKLETNFGLPPSNRKARPWNGGKIDPDQRSLSGQITALEHQAILITSIWMTEKTQCCPAEVKGICYYSMQDVSLGQFLRDSCFNLSLKCQNPSCKKSVLDHSLSFIHNDGMINISVERMDNPIPSCSLQNKQNDRDSVSMDYEPIATWTFCTKCNQVVTPLVFLSKQTWQWSFGKFLEVYFYNRDAIINAPGHLCFCRMQTNSQLFFGCSSLAARFTYEKIAPYSVFCRRQLPYDESFHRLHSLQDLEHISVTSSSLFVRYLRKIDAISRETRELFGSAVNKPEHLQAVLSELNLISSEVDNASKVLQEKLSSVTAKFSNPEKKNDHNEALLNSFPWYSRRFLFLLASAWNERLSAAGQALSAMKKIQHAGGSGRGDSAVVPVIVGDASTDDVIEGMKRIRTLQEGYARNYNVAKMTMPRSHKVEGGLFEGNILPDGRFAALEQEAEIDDEEFYSDPDNEIDFEEDIDADVLASRNRVYSPHASLTRKTSRQQMDKVFNSQRPSNFAVDTPTVPDQGPSPLGFANNYDSSGQLESLSKSKTVTAGGAVKSALTRFFNRGGNKEDPYVIDLGYFGMGRPRLQPGIGGLVIPVFDDQPSTIIAHSLASSDYDVQFKQFLTASSQPDFRPEKNELSRKDIERRMLGRNKSHIKHTFRDFDEKGQQLCKFVCTTFWSLQFNSVRQAFMNPQKDSSGNDYVQGSIKLPGSNKLDIEISYIQSLATSSAWAASGGKSGAAFSRTSDDRFVIKCISRTELQMFLDCAPAYFEYLNKAFFHGLPTVLCKIVGVYQIGYHNRVTGRRTMDQVAVMQNIFYGRKISKIFDLKGSLRGRFTRKVNPGEVKKSRKVSSQYRRAKSDNSDSDSFYSGDEEDDDTESFSSGGNEKDGKNSIDAEKGGKSDKLSSVPTLLDGDFLEFTSGRPMPLTDRAKAVFHMSILNDTLFLSIINVLDYSILVGIDDENMELVVGIIDFMRQYDILKQMERVGKSLPMVVGSEAPTIIQPPLYKARFTNAMERYFMTVPSKWTAI